MSSFDFAAEEARLLQLNARINSKKPDLIRRPESVGNSAREYKVTPDTDPPGTYYGGSDDDAGNDQNNLNASEVDIKISNDEKLSQLYNSREILQSLEKILKKGLWYLLLPSLVVTSKLYCL